MLHLFPGQLGHFFVVTAFVFAGASALAYFLGLRSENPEDSKKYTRFGRTFFLIHAVSAVGTVVMLFWIIYNHYYEYHYAWSHSSNNLPVYYMISCFWEGQEGSFLLWIFWHVVLGSLLIILHPKWEAPTMMVFMMVQAFLGSMILGVILPGIQLKIGSSPFILLREFMHDAPIFSTNPDFVPEDGTGLNPLLQNYWMVIHPPVTFLGFASCLIPFSFLIGALVKKDYKGWVSYALPWSLFAVFFLGLGIIMGGYWAYETLNFGGYWNWDPVENAVYIPWLVLVASVHTLFMSKTYGKSLKASMILVVATFSLILYSTFLTRSGVLGDTSVHSFTDLGLSGQLLIYLLFFVGLSIFLLARNWKSVPDQSKELNSFSREFWVFIGVFMLILASFQVLMTTSIPVFNAILNNLGISSNLAPPADPIAHYGTAQLWFAVGVSVLSALGPFFWWNRLDWTSFKNHITLPLIISLLGSSLIMLLWGIQNISYILLLTCAIFAISANLFTLQKLYKAGLRLTGGSIAHIGLAILLIGILFSSGYSRTVSQNLSGKIYHEEFSDEMNLKNVLLWRGKTYQMGDYSLTYKGPRVETRYGSEMIDRDKIIHTGDPNFVIVENEVEPGSEIPKRSVDTVEIIAENNYYEIEVSTENGKRFTLFPRAQINPDMGGLLASPDVKKFFNRDLYAHVSSIVNPEEPVEWKNENSLRIKIGDTIFLKDHPAVFEKMEMIEEIAGHQLSNGDVGVKARIRVFGPGEEELIEPIFIIHDQMIGRLPDESIGLGLRLTLMEILPDENLFVFKFQSTQADYVILKAMEKPWINLLWGGTLLCLFGVILSMSRRFKDLKTD